MLHEPHKARLSRRERQALLDAQRVMQAAGIPATIEQTRLVVYFPTDIAVFSLKEVRDPQR